MLILLPSLGRGGDAPPEEGDAIIPFTKFCRLFDSVVGVLDGDTIEVLHNHAACILLLRYFLCGLSLVHCVRYASL